VSEIAAASAEQAAGIDQVNSAVTQMDTTTQQNAALVEEASAASKALEHQAQHLVELVSFFTTRDETAPTDRASAAGRMAQPAAGTIAPAARPAPPRSASAPRTASRGAPEAARRRAG
jgi:methyl-accepting chemotaxis protein